MKEIIMKNFLFVYFVIVFILSLIIHFSTYTLTKYYSILAYSNILQPTILIGFISVIVNIKQKKENKIGMSDLFKNYPNKCLIILLVFLTAAIYFYSNFMICFSLLQDGSPDILGGTFIQNNHGKIKVITELAYNKLRLIELRMFSGHWLIFSLFPILHSFYKKMFLKIAETRIA